MNKLFLFLHVWSQYAKGNCFFYIFCPNIPKGTVYIPLYLYLSHVCIGPASSLHALARSLQPAFLLIRIDSHRCFSVWSDLGVALDLFSNFKWVGSSGYLSERLGYITTVSGPFLVSRTHCSWFFACAYSSRILPARSCTLVAASFFVNSNWWPPMFQHLERFGRGTRPILKR